MAQFSPLPFYLFPLAFFVFVRCSHGGVVLLVLRFSSLGSQEWRLLQLSFGGDLDSILQRRGLEYYDILRLPVVQINANCILFRFRSRMTDISGDVCARHQYAFDEPAFLVGSGNPSGVFLLLAPYAGESV